MSVNIVISLFDNQVEFTYFSLYYSDELLLFLNTDVLLLQLVLKVLDLLEELLDLWYAELSIWVYSDCSWLIFRLLCSISFTSDRFKLSFRASSFLRWLKLSVEARNLFSKSSLINYMFTLSSDSCWIRE